MYVVLRQQKVEYYIKQVHNQLDNVVTRPGAQSTCMGDIEAIEELSYLGVVDGQFEQALNSQLQLMTMLLCGVEQWTPLRRHYSKPPQIDISIVLQLARHYGRRWASIKAGYIWLQRYQDLGYLSVPYLAKPWPRCSSIS